MSPHGPRGTRLRWWLRFLAVQAVAVALLLEAGLRLYNPIPVRVRGNEIVLPVRQVYRFDNGSTRQIDPVTIHTRNAIGFRGPDPPRDFARRPTLVTIGGSTTESLFLSDGRTWSDVLAARLSREWPDIWVNNAGLDGHTTFGHLILLRAFVLRLAPTLAVFLVGVNDVCEDAPRGFDSGIVPEGGRLRAAVNALADRSELVTVAWNLARAARARQRGLGHSEVDVHAVDHLVLDESVMQATETACAPTLPGYAARLREIAALTRAHHIEPVWLTQPALYGDTVDPATGVELSTVKVNGRGNGRLEWRLLERQNDVTREVAAALEVPLIDLARALPKDSRYFYDFLHFTNEGSVQVGELVAAGVAPVLRRTWARR